MGKKRLDVLLLEQELAPSREKAKSIILSGIVYADNQKVDKAGLMIDENIKLEVRDKKPPYVSRGGHKIEKALEAFAIDPAGFCILDIGASTGGFTDCLLQRGARKVYAIDVGYGQLAWSLRIDERVVCMERTNIRNVTPEQLEDIPDMAVIDVSFISLRIVLPVVYNLLNKSQGVVACLIKPQFEAGREKVGKKGVVREAAIHKEVLDNFLEHAKKAGFSVRAMNHSPIKGPQGNIEFLGYLGTEQKDYEIDTALVVETAHQELNGG